MIERDRHARASALFLELRSLPAEARAARLAGLDIDRSVRDEVRSLLAHDPELRERKGEECGEMDERPSECDATLPTMIGPYRVLRRLGRGGGGYVLLGEQANPVRRLVAIKLVPRAMIDPILAARFDVERRALERIEHPFIPRILDAGVTADGLPYLVMDFVSGVSITEFCTARGLKLQDRLSLVLDVANAVQHAHQRGVIHRDIKPDNILVVEDSGQWTPRVLDFGIAKSVDGSFGSGEPITVGLPLGTPAYMAPEQTGPAPVDTRADVYALGAVLYVLVSARTPLEPARDAVDLLHRIRTEVPSPASRWRLADDSFRADIVARSVLADLDRVIAKALEKDPERRYPTVASFADDIRRVLRGEPVEARPQTRTYRMARFAGRHRALVAGFTLTCLATLLGVAGLVAGFVAADRGRAEAMRQSEAQAAINRFLTDDLLAAASPEESSSDVTALQLLDRASRRVEVRFVDRPLVAAAIHHTLGAAYGQLGAFDQAQHHLDQAIGIRRKWAGAEAADTVRSELVQAGLLGHRQQFAEAEAEFSRLMPRARRLLDRDPALYTALNDLGTIYASMGRSDEAIQALMESLDGRREVLGENEPQVIVTMSNLAQAFDVSGDTVRSLELMVQAMKIAERLPDEPRMLLIGLSNNIGATYQDMGQYADAAPYLRRAADLASQEFGAENPVTLTIQANLAGLEARVGDPMRAAELYASVARAQTTLLGPNAFDTLAARYGHSNSNLLGGRSAEAVDGFEMLLPDVESALGARHWLTGQTHSSLAVALQRIGRIDEATVHARSAVEIFEEIYESGHSRLDSARALLQSLMDGAARSME